MARIFALRSLHYLAETSALSSQWRSVAEGINGLTLSDVTPVSADVLPESKKLQQFLFQLESFHGGSNNVVAIRRVFSPHLRDVPFTIGTGMSQMFQSDESALLNDEPSTDTHRYWTVAFIGLFFVF